MRVATFNVENLNAVGHRFVGRDGARSFSTEQHETKVRFIAERLNSAAADIVGFQEIFSEKSLADSVTASDSMKNAYVSAPLAIPTDSHDLGPGKPVSDGPHVGIASLYPFSREPFTIRDFPESMHLLVPSGPHGQVGDVHQIGIRRFERPVLRAEIDVEGLPGLIVFVAHLKSKRPKYMPGEFKNDPVVSALGSVRSLIVRAAEAAALRALIVAAREERNEDGSRRPVIVLGDLNDDIDSVTTEMLVGKRPFDSDGNGEISRKDYYYRTRDLMLTAFELAPPTSPAYTHVYDGKGSVLDLILVSADFFGTAGEQRARVISSAILTDHLDDQPIDVRAIPKPAPYKDRKDKDILEDKEWRGRISNPALGSDHGIPISDIEVLEEA